MQSPHQRRKKNSPGIDLFFSVIFHGLIILVIFVFAAHEGYLGKKLEAITAELVPKEKPPESVKPPEPKIEQPRPEPAKAVEQPKLVEAAPAQTTAPPPGNSGPAVAPAPEMPAAFAFGDGAKAVISSSDPVVLYKSAVEFALRSNWDRPPDLDDFGYIAEVEIQVDAEGRITGSIWKKGSGNALWDESVKKAIANTKSLGNPPPKGFPGKVLVRFDVVASTTDLSVQ